MYYSVKIGLLSFTWSSLQRTEQFCLTYSWIVCVCVCVAQKKKMCVCVCVSKKVNKARDYVLQAKTEGGTGTACVPLAYWSHGPDELTSWCAHSAKHWNIKSVNQLCNKTWPQFSAFSVIRLTTSHIRMKKCTGLFNMGLSLPFWILPQATKNLFGFFFFFLSWVKVKIIPKQRPSDKRVKR